MTVAERQSSTIKYMFGKWAYQNNGVNISLIINDFPRVVKLNYNGEIEEFDNNAHWFGDHHLCFYGPYYVFFADENCLIFGKHKSSVIGDYEWQYEFHRVN